MLAIRLARTGRNKYPTYRIVAAESARATTGKFVAILGHYNPHTKELVIKKDETLVYIKNGAQPSNSVIKLLQSEKLELPQWVTKVVKNKPPRKAAQEKATAAQAAAQSVSEGVDDQAAVAQAATDNAGEVTANVTEAAPEDTATGEEAQADAAVKVEEAGDAAVEEAKAEAQAESDKESAEA